MSCACACKDQTLTDEQKQILKAMADSQQPCGAKDIAAATSLDSKAISGQITVMKKKGLVDSPVRCKYAITENGRSVLKA